MDKQTVMPWYEVPAEQVDLDSIEKSDDAGDKVRMDKYFQNMKAIPALEGKRARSRAAEYLDDLQVFTSKWKERFLPVVLMAFMVSALSAQEVGYLVCTSGIGAVKCEKVYELDEVQELAKLKFPDVKIDVAKQLKHSDYIQIMTSNSALYIEKKRVVRKKNGKVKFRRIKQ